MACPAVCCSGCALVPLGDANPGANMTNFTVLIGIALSDQREEGCGNLGVLRGMHQPIAATCAQQSKAGHAIGPGSPGWERLDSSSPNGSGIHYLPDGVEGVGLDGAIAGSDGKLWPTPSLVKLNVGDAVLVHHGCPHSASWNLCDDPRVMVYFRLTKMGRPDGCSACYPEALENPWLEWQGLAEVLRGAGGAAKL